MKTSKLYQEIRENRHHILFERLFSVDKNNQVVPIPNVELRILNGLPFVYNTNPNEMLPLQNLNAFQETLPSVSHSPFTSKGYPLKKDWKSYNTYDLGRAFFSDGYVNKNHCFQVFDHINLLSQPWLKDESLYYKKKEIPISVYTTNSEEELKNKYSRLEIDYDEIAVFFIKKPEQKEINVSVNLGDSLLKLSNLKDEIAMQNKRWTVSELELKQLTENFSAQKVVAFLNKNNMLFAEEEAHISGLFPTKKTKVHLTIGMFFDGTGNNRFNSENIYYKNLNSGNLVYTQIPKEVTLKNGKKTDNTSSYWNPYSNIVLLHDLYDKKDYNDQKKTVTLKQYVQGIGTLKGEEDDILGSAFGEGTNGIIGKVAEGCRDLAKQISNILGDDKEIGTITFDVFGFSRGAAAARHFCNEIVGKDSITNTYIKAPLNSTSTNEGNTSINNKTKSIPNGLEYNLGTLGKALKQLKKQSSLKSELKAEAPIKIRFLGLFDTVVSQMIIENHLGKKLDLLSPVTKIPYGLGTYIETKLDVIKQKIDNLPIDQIVHLTAKDEWRENFPLTRTGKKETIFEIALPGTHSDIGGGYAAIKEDEDIVAYDLIKHDALETPKTERIKKLKDFYVSQELCIDAENEISIKKGQSISVGAGGVKETLFQLVAKRNIIPRYSVVNMYVMKELAKLCGVLFLEKTTSPFSFENETPKALVKYQEELIQNIKLKFQKEKEKPIKTKLEKNKFLHLSSNYNLSKVIEKKGKTITGYTSIDELFYINAPHYANDDKSSYARKIHTPNQ
jgi:hypothetical protein